LRGLRSPEAALILMLVCAPPLFAQEGLLPGDAYAGLRTVPEERREEWVVGFTALRPSGLSGENRYLIHALPLLIQEQLSPIETHVLSEEEIRAYRGARIAERLQSLVEELEEVRGQKEELGFDRRVEPAERRRTSVELARHEQALAEAIAWLKRLPPDRIDVRGSKPIAFKRGAESGSLLPRPDFSPAGFSERQDLDLLLWGDLEEIQGYLYLKLRAYHAYLAREVFVFETGGSAEELQRFLSEAVSRGLSEEILGRPRASLTISAEPEQSTVEVNGEYRGTGTVQAPFLEPGSVRVTVRAPGYRTTEREYSLSAGQERAVTIALEPEEIRSLTVVTDPAGADVYIDSRWQGRTPLSFRLTAPGKRMIVRKEGYRDVEHILSEDGPSVLSFFLSQAILDRQEWQDRKRDRFYTSLGIWALSVPLPVFLYGFAVDHAYAASRAEPGSDKYRYHYSTMEATYYAYFATLFVSVTLFVKMFLNLLDYIHFVDETSP